MKIRDVLDYVIELQEPAFSETVLLRWLNQVEAEIQTEVLLLAVDGIVQYTAEDMQAELIVPAPFSKLYEDYLNWRIALAQGEAERANNLQVIYNESYLAYVRFVCDTISPGSGCAEQLRYYLTAYQIAVKYGYNGTEEGWVKSLKGANGEPGAGLRIVAQVESEATLPNLENTEEDIGKGYLVGFGTSALLYIWDGRNWFYKTQLSGKGEKGEPGKQGEPGKNGADGVGIRSIAFKSATTSGNIYTVTLTNDKTYDLIAPPGPAGPVGPTGETGSGIDVEYDETTGTVSIVNGEGGGGGAGADGVGIHSIVFKAAADDGNIYTVILTNGNTYDFAAPKGPAGKDGTSVTVTNVSESTADGGTNVVTFSDGKNLNVKNGRRGSDGRGVSSMTYDDATNKWTVTYTDGTSTQIDGPEIPDASALGRLVVTFTESYNEEEDVYEVTTDSNFDEVFNAARNGENVVAKFIPAGVEYFEEYWLALEGWVAESESYPYPSYLIFTGGGGESRYVWEAAGVWAYYDEYVRDDVVGEPGGVATLDWNGKVPKEQLPELTETLSCVFEAGSTSSNCSSDNVQVTACKAKKIDDVVLVSAELSLRNVSNLGYLGCRLYGVGYNAGWRCVKRTMLVGDSGNAATWYCYSGGGSTDWVSGDGTVNAIGNGQPPGTFSLLMIFHKD